MIKQMSRERIDWINVALVFIAGVVIGLAAGFILFSPAPIFGLETMPAEYTQVIEITENATNTTQGMMIDSYVQNIKDEICPALKGNQTAYEGCMNA